LSDIQDHAGGKLLLEQLLSCFARLKLIWADSAYNKGSFVIWVKATLGWDVEVVEHPWTSLLNLSYGRRDFAVDHVTTITRMQDAGGACGTTTHTPVDEAVVVHLGCLVDIATVDEDWVTH
jgi:hypothetical protein